MGAGAFRACVLIAPAARRVNPHALRRAVAWFCQTRVMRWLGKISSIANILLFIVFASMSRVAFPTVTAITLALSSLALAAMGQPFSKWARTHVRR